MHLPGQTVRVTCKEIVLGLRIFSRDHFRAGRTSVPSLSGHIFSRNKASGSKWLYIAHRGYLARVKCTFAGRHFLGKKPDSRQ